MNFDRYRKLSIRLVRFITWIVALSIIVLLLDYSLDVSKRLSREPACKWNIVPNPENLPYVARWCKLTKDTALLQLYAPGEKTLLAERMFIELDAPLLWWTPDKLGYDVQMGHSIKLPPTLIDRVRARLP